MVLLVNHVPSFSYDGMGNMTNDGLTACTYDAEGRPTQYQFVVGSSPQTVEGDLTWNQNGTLKTLAITDPPTPANAQTRSYGYDDLARIGIRRTRERMGMRLLVKIMELPHPSNIGLGGTLRMLGRATCRIYQSWNHSGKTLGKHSKIEREGLRVFDLDPEEVGMCGI